MSKKVVITARNFDMEGGRAVQSLKEAGFEVVLVEDSLSKTEEELYEAVKDADALIVGPEKLSGKLLERLPGLKLISRRGIGIDSIDLKALERQNIVLTRTVGLVEGAVAEHVLAYMLYFARQIDKQNASMKQHRWERMMMGGLKGRTLGLIGFGGIGKEIARRAYPFGMNILYYQRHPKKEEGEEYHASYRTLSELLRESDYVSVNLPLTEETKGFIRYEQLLEMKPGAVLINIARGAVVDAYDLARALKERRIAGAAVDVFEKEPCTGSPLIDCETAVLTPHTAPYTCENFAAMNDQAAKNVIDFFKRT